MQLFRNPFRPGAGHPPPFLAGRKEESNEFKKLLDQDVVVKNLIITGLRGTGKTVLADSLKPLALEKGWLWVGADLSEATSISETNVAIRILTDLSIITAQIVISEIPAVGFRDSSEANAEKVTLNYDYLVRYFSAQSGLTSDKLKATLEFVWVHISKNEKVSGIVFVYDEAQNMSDRKEKDEYPLSMLLDVFQSTQKKKMPFLLVLVGLPTLFPKLVETRTYSERMFNIVELSSLTIDESKEAILKPINDAQCPVKFSAESVLLIAETSGGYPYFIQFICREVYDSFLVQLQNGNISPSVPIGEIVQKLDTEFFGGRWNNLTDKQRELMGVIACLENCDKEFSIQEIITKYKELKPKSKVKNGSHVNQMLAALGNVGLVYKSRHGKYALGVPLMSAFIKKQQSVNDE